MKKLEIHKQETVNRMVESLMNQAYNHKGVESLKGLTIKNFNEFLDDLFKDGGEIRCEKFTDLAMDYALQFGEIESAPFTERQWSCIESAIKIIAARVIYLSIGVKAMKTRNPVIYFVGGEDYRGQHELTQADRKKWMILAKQSKQVGYLSGYRYFDNKTDAVLVYFTDKPSEDDIERRRRNGLLRAKWYWLG